MTEFSQACVSYAAGTMVLFTFMEPFNPPANLMKLDTLIILILHGRRHREVKQTTQSQRVSGRARI